MRPLKVLVVVSNPEHMEQLTTRPEVQAIVRAHGAENVTILYNPKRIEIAEIIGQENFEVIHLAGHCTSQGFALQEGFLPPEALAAYALSLSPGLLLVVINSCEGREIADVISASSNVDVVYSIAKVEDEECVDYAVLFHSKLRNATVNNCYEAYRLVVVDPTNTKFRYRKGTLRNATVNKMLQDSTELQEIKAAVDTIQAYLVGTLDKQGLVGRVQALEKEHHRVDERVTVLEKVVNRQKLEPSLIDESIFYRRLAIITVIILVFCIVVYLLSRSLLG